MTAVGGQVRRGARSSVCGALAARSSPQKTHHRHYENNETNEKYERDRRVHDLSGGREHQSSIRGELDRARRPQPKAGRGAGEAALSALEGQRAKLLRLHYQDQISADLFAKEEARLTSLLQHAGAEAAEAATTHAEGSDLVNRFDQVAAMLDDLDLDRLWDEATEQERRTLLDELVSHVEVFEDHLEVHVNGAPRLNVTLEEVGLAAPGLIGGVGGGT